MDQPFTVHWSPVASAPGGRALLALWPAPMNHDVCFRDAGFTDFGDTDGTWDENANGILTRLLEALAGYGRPRLLSKPAEHYRPWYRRLFRTPEVLGMREQIEAPMWWGLPDCIVGFGESGAALQTGSEHHIFWITLPDADAGMVSRLLTSVSGPHPLIRTDLDWDRLRPVDNTSPAPPNA